MKLWQATISLAVIQLTNTHINSPAPVNPTPFIIFIIIHTHLFFQAVIQYYEVEADNEYVIRGNAAIMKCKIPSYISDFVSVDMWSDTDNNTFYPNATEGGS